MKAMELTPLLEQHHQASWGWALSCTFGAREDAEDLLQTAYLKVLDGRARYGGRSAFKTWLFSVIRKTAIDRRRRNALLKLRLEELARAVNPWSPAASSEEGDRRLEIRDRFRAHLATLSARQREVLHLVFYCDLTLDDAAEVMAVSVGAARSHYARGKKKMKQLLELDRRTHG